MLTGPSVSHRCRWPRERGERREETERHKCREPDSGMPVDHSGVTQLSLEPVSPASVGRGAAAHTSPGSAASQSSRNSTASTRSTPAPPSEEKRSPGQPASARHPRRRFQQSNTPGTPPGSPSTSPRMVSAAGTMSEGVPSSSRRAASESAAASSPPQSLERNGVPTLPPDKRYHFFVCHHQVCTFRLPSSQAAQMHRFLLICYTLNLTSSPPPRSAGEWWRPVE